MVISNDPEISSIKLFKAGKISKYGVIIKI